MGRPSLTLALAVAAALALWQGLWLVAAVALAGLVRLGRTERIAIAADAIVFLGLVGQAEPLWVAVLIAASWVAGEHDRGTILILTLASLAAFFVPLDWTVLTALLAALRVWAAAWHLVRARRAV